MIREEAAVAARPALSAESIAKTSKTSPTPWPAYMVARSPSREVDEVKRSMSAGLRPKPSTSAALITVQAMPAVSTVRIITRGMVREASVTSSPRVTDSSKPA